MAVWVTRPRQNARPLAAALRRLGVGAVAVPALRLAACANTAALAEFWRAPRRYDAAVVLSAEAARRFARAARQKLDAPVAVTAGKETARALGGVFARVVCPADVADTPALLCHPLLSGAAAVAVIGGVRGGGEAGAVSPRLCGELRRRGKQVLPVPLYRRLPPPPDDGRLAAMARAGRLKAAVAYSAETVAHMKTMTAPDNGWLAALPLFTIHPAIAAKAKERQFANVMTAPAAAAGMARAVADYLAQN